MLAGRVFAEMEVWVFDVGVCVITILSREKSSRHFSFPLFWGLYALPKHPGKAHGVLRKEQRGDLQFLHIEVSCLVGDLNWCV